MELYPAGLDVAGVFKLFWDDLKKPIDERYIHRLITDTTFRRIAGEMNEWEVVIFLKALQRAVTIARAYINGASTEFYERLFHKFRAVKLEITGKPIAFKRLVEGRVNLGILTRPRATRANILPVFLVLRRQSLGIGSVISVAKELPSDKELNLTFEARFQAWGRLLELIHTYVAEEHTLWLTHLEPIMHMLHRAENWAVWLEYNAQVRRRALNETFDPSVLQEDILRPLQTTTISKAIKKELTGELHSTERELGSSSRRSHPYDKTDNGHPFRPSSSLRCFI
ncbi:hypothetical protein C8F04DRAFT_1254541 [Mycena alexandri]|uniref:Uncharacterized protein n=1 Tax=Mycena alexandri TaxID=1745969 RepID=A0AAD6T613_9AGAR|nr:hypothetical protein C8F04DRAFT_1254541 [Mycena alexandri]